MASIRWGIVPLLLILAVCPASSIPSIIQMKPEPESLLVSGRAVPSPSVIDLYCESWRFTVETNSAGRWSRIPERCADFVKEYTTGALYSADLEAVSDCASAYAREVQPAGNGKDAWVFDIDETLLSNLPYYAAHGFGSETFDEHSFDNWVDVAEAPAFPASLRLYKELQELGFTIFLLTGRSEFQRNCTERNLRNVGFSNWKRLILRGDSDQGKPAVVFKSEKRKEMEDEGYIIRGNSGDQWSDLTGLAVGERSFKLPNLLYFVS